MKKRVALSFVSLLPALLVTVTVTGQTPFDRDLIYIHVTATDSKGRAVTLLEKRDFRIFEDNVPQEIRVFSPADIPLSVGFLVDAVGNTKDEMKAMATGGLMQNGASRDEFFIAEVGTTSLNDSVYQALNQLQRRGANKQALVLFTSRSDPGGYSYSKVKELLRGQNVLFYTAAMPGRTDLPGDQGRQLLKELTELSGGNSYFPSSESQLQDIYSKIGVELRHQYLIGYRPTNSATDGKWRKIKVTAEFKDPQQKVHKLTVRAKKGYYATVPTR